MINLQDYEDAQEITNLLAACMYPDEERVKREVETYIKDPSRRLLGVIINEELAGLLGVIQYNEEEAELKHIAIKSSYRKQGLGKKMIMTYMKDNRIRRIKAETDKDAVEFYKRIGFEIVSLGEKYSGVERFECRFSLATHSPAVRNDEKTTLYIVRHGQTEWNVQHKFQGHQDSPLTELGIQQAKWLGESFKNERIDIIYTSSSFRAVRTAELIRQAREIEIRQSDALKEMNLGDWEGRTQAEVERSDLESFDHFWNDPEKFRVQSGETFNEVSERAIRQFNQILNDQRGKSILLVTHTIVVKLLMAMCENMPIKHIWKHHYIHPTSLCKVEFTNGLPEIILHGDISHFKNI